MLGWVKDVVRSLRLYVDVATENCNYRRLKWPAAQAPVSRRSPSLPRAGVWEAMSAVGGEIRRRPPGPG